MGVPTAVLAVVMMAAWGPQAAMAQDPDVARQQAERAAAAILAGDRGTQGPAVCTVLESGIVEEVFGVESDAVSYRPGSKYVPHPLCIASWDASAASVSLTVHNQVFDSSAAAVASLESAVATLERGVTVTVRGKERTTQVDFDDWMEGVGDRAAWAPRNKELLVAANGVRFAVAVKGVGDEAASRATAVEVARRVIDKL